MVVSDNPKEQAKAIASVFLQRTLKEAFHVVVTVDGQPLELCDTAVFVFEDAIFQVVVDVHQKGYLELDGCDGIQVSGDYLDRTGVELVPFDLGVKRVERVFGVWEQGKGKHLIGFFLLDTTGEPCASVNVHLDDLVLGKPLMFWEYLEKVMVASGGISIGEIFNRNS